MLRKIKKNKLTGYFLGWGLVLPAVIFIGVFLLVPLIQTVSLAFFAWDGVAPWKFVGIKNFIYEFTKDRFFYTSLKNTIIFTIVTSIGSMLVGLILAVVLDLRVRFWKTYRFIFFMSYSLAVLAVSLLWAKIFQYDGLFNSLLQGLGLGKFAQSWFENPNYALAIIIFTTIWQYSSFPMIFFLAGMQNISESIYEAAMIDGASTIRRIMAITIPLLKHIFSTITVLLLIFNFRVFAVVFVLTGGGPSGQTEVLGVTVYKYFKLLRYGNASVVAFFGVILAVILAFIYRKVSGYDKLN